MAALKHNGNIIFELKGWKPCPDGTEEVCEGERWEKTWRLMETRWVLEKYENRSPGIRIRRGTWKRLLRVKEYEDRDIPILKGLLKRRMEGMGYIVN